MELSNRRQFLQSSLKQAKAELDEAITKYHGALSRVELFDSVMSLPVTVEAKDTLNSALEIMEEASQPAKKKATKTTRRCVHCNKRKDTRGFYLHEMYCADNPARKRNLAKRNKTLAAHA